MVFLVLRLLLAVYTLFG